MPRPKPKTLPFPKPPKCGTHALASRVLQSRAIKVALVGVGGNGSQMLSGLARLHIALSKLGYPAGLEVTVWDPDFVSESNVGRQLFFPADIGQPKAFALVNRFNLSYGFQWEAEAEEFEHRGHEHFLITCVDSAKARREIHAQIWDKGVSAPLYWMDLGNRQRTGQVILGQPRGAVREASIPSSEFLKGKLGDQVFERYRLPCVTDFYPELLDESIEEDNAPSCSLAEALKKQDLFINQSVATPALQLLWCLLREKQIQHHGAFIDLESGRINPLPVPSHIQAPEKEVKKAA